MKKDCCEEPTKEKSRTFRIPLAGLLIGAFTMLLCLPPASGRVGPLRSLVLGILLGIGLWVFPLSLTMSSPAILVLAWFAKRTMSWRDLASCAGIGVVGAWLGMRPWAVSYTLLGQSAVTELFGGAIAGSGESWSRTSFLRAKPSFSRYAS